VEGGRGGEGGLSSTAPPSAHHLDRVPLPLGLVLLVVHRVVQQQRLLLQRGASGRSRRAWKGWGGGAGRKCARVGGWEGCPRACRASGNGGLCAGTRRAGHPPVAQPQRARKASPGPPRPRWRRQTRRRPLQLRPPRLRPHASQRRLPWRRPLQRRGPSPACAPWAAGAGAAPALTRPPLPPPRRPPRRPPSAGHAAPAAPPLPVAALRSTRSCCRRWRACLEGRGQEGKKEQRRRRNKKRLEEGLLPCALCPPS
jgi:hypothetical protein